MYHVGDLVVYGSVGICRIEAIGVPFPSAAGAGQSYYTLAQCYKSGRIYVPTGSQAAMRPILSREEAMQLIERIPEVDETIYEERQMSVFKEHYQKLLGSHDCVDLVHIIKSLYVKRQLLAKKGRNLGQLESRYMKQAEGIFYDELALSLDMAREEVQGYVEHAVRQVIRRSGGGFDRAAGQVQ